MTNKENIWAWFQNLHLPDESKTDLERENSKGSYEIFKFS